MAYNFFSIINKRFVTVHLTMNEVQKLNRTSFSMPELKTAVDTKQALEQGVITNT